MRIPMKAILCVSWLAAASGSSAADQSTGGFDAVASGAVGYSKSSGTSNVEGMNYGLGASAAYTTMSKWGGQLDFASFQQDFKGESHPRSSSADLAGHLYYRESDWLAGAFVQRRRFSANNNYLDTHERFLGIEGQLYREDTTFYGQLGEDKWSNFGVDFHGRFVATRLSYFANENMLLSGGIDLIREDDKGYKYNQNNYKLGVESRLNDGPLSLFAEYTRIDESEPTGWNVSTDIVLVGVKVNFGKTTLRKREREGAGLMPAPKVLLLL